MNCQFITERSRRNVDGKGRKAEAVGLKVRVAGLSLVETVSAFECRQRFGFIQK